MGRLFWKFFFAFWLSLLAAGIGVGTTVWLHRQGDAPEASLAGGPRAALLVNAAAATLRHGGAAALRELLAEGGALRGAPLFAVDAAGRDLLDRPVPADSLQRARSLAAQGDSPAARQVAGAGGEYLLFVPAEAAPRRRPPPHERPFAGVPLAFLLAASVGFSALLAWYLAQPIRHLRWAFDAAAQGRLDTRVQPRIGRRRDEIADLGRDFDHMAQRLQQLVESQRRLLHDVSHELRSPLARLQAAIGLARQNPAKLAATLERIERESMRLDVLVGELLTLSRLEAAGAEAGREEVDLMELVAAIAEDARFEARAAGRDLVFRGEGEVPAAVRAEPLHRAFENVMRNAVKFTREGTTVEVDARVEPAQMALRVTVSDRGPGVAEAELEAIFQPFHRGEAGAAGGGFGLGLAIARRAVELHGGTIRAAGREGGGLRVDILLPLERAGARG